jgi:WD40 repeat protein
MRTTRSLTSSESAKRDNDKEEFINIKNSKKKQKNNIISNNDESSQAKSFPSFNESNSINNSFNNSFVLDCNTTSSTIPLVNSSGFSNYEMKRLANIRQNEEFLANLGFKDVLIDETKLIAIKNTKANNKSKQKTIFCSSRRSERISSARLDDYKITIEEEQKEQDDYIMLPSSSALCSSSSIDEYSERIKNLSSVNHQIFNTTRISKLLFHPTNPILFIGNKEGFLFIWDLKSTNNNLRSSYHQQHHFHESKINNLFINEEKDENKLFSVSNDGSVKLFDIAKEIKTVVFQDLNEFYCRRMFIDSSFSKLHTNSLYVGKSNGNLSFIDTRKSQNIFVWDHRIHINQINSVQEHPTMNHLVVTAGSGKNGLICVHDVRNMSTALVSIDQNLESINAANVSPDGKYLISVSQDNTLRSWTSFSDPSVRQQKCNVYNTVLFFVLIFFNNCYG